MTSGWVVDSSIDLTGHAIVSQSGLCLPGFCIALGWVLADGVTRFNDVLGVWTPRIP